MRSLITWRGAENVTTPQPSRVESGSTKIIWNVCTTRNRRNETSSFQSYQKSWIRVPRTGQNCHFTFDNIPCIIVQPSKSALFKSSLVPLEVSLVGVIISAKLGFSSCIERWSRRTNRNEVISYRNCSSTPHGNRFDKSSPDIGVWDTSEITEISPRQGLFEFICETDKTVREYLAVVHRLTFVRVLKLHLQILLEKALPASTVSITLILLYRINLILVSWFPGNGLSVESGDGPVYNTDGTMSESDFFIGNIIKNQFLLPQFE